MGLSVFRLLFIIKKVKMNPKVLRFAKRPCALIVVSLSHVNDTQGYSALRADASRQPEGTLPPPSPQKRKKQKNNPILNILGI